MVAKIGYRTLDQLPQASHSARRLVPYCAGALEPSTACLRARVYSLINKYVFRLVRNRGR